MSLESRSSSRRTEAVQTSLSVLCGMPGARRTVTREVAALGYAVDAKASVQLLIDLPSGYGLDVLKTSRRTRQTVVVTCNSCVEYLDDLWGLGAGALIISDALLMSGLRENLALAVEQLSRGRRWRLTPGGASTLTATERAVLREAAMGEDNARIAAVLGMEVQSVKNAMCRVYRKLGVRSHAQAALYYWDINASRPCSCDPKLGTKVLETEYVSN